MFRKKKTRQVIGVFVEMIPNPGDTLYKKRWSMQFVIPPGGSWTVDRWTEKLRILEADGTLVRMVRFQAGFTVSVSPVHWQDKPIEVEVKEPHAQ